MLMRARQALWAALLARIFEVFPLICPLCGGQMRIIAFITFSADIQKILDHIGVGLCPQSSFACRLCSFVAAAHKTF